MKQELNELALFAGVGGGLLGTKPLGLKPRIAVEIDNHCRRVLRQRQKEKVFNNFPIWHDIRTFNGLPYRGTIDIITGGFPCQAFSSAAHGKNTALDLWPEMKRIVSEVQSEYVFAENVKKKPIERAAEDCATMGYTTQMLSLSAKDLGADHIRSRYWLLAYANDKSKLLWTINAKMAKCGQFYQGFWETYPDESRMAYGMANWVERYKAIGNGQVPIVAAAALWSLTTAIRIPTMSRRYTICE